MFTTPPPATPDKPAQEGPPLPQSEREKRAAAADAKFKERVSTLNDALDVDWDALEKKLANKVKVFLEHLGHFTEGGHAESTLEFPVNDKPMYFTFSARRKAPPEPKPRARFVMWDQDNAAFAYTEHERSEFLDAHPGYKYAQIPQE